MQGTRDQLLAENASLRAELESLKGDVFDASDIGFCIIEMHFDAQGKADDYRFLTVNRAFARHTGLANAEGRWMRDLVPDHEDHWFEVYGRVALTGEPLQFENDATALGRYFMVQAARIGDPALRRVSVLFTDITKRRLAEQALAESERHWRGLFEHFDEAFALAEVIRDEEGEAVDWRFLDVNPACCRLLDRPADAVRARTLRELFPGLAPGWISDAARVAESGQSRPFIRPLDDVRRWYEGRLHPLPGDRFMVIFQDVSELRRAAQRREGLLHLSDRLRTMDSPDDIAGVAAEILGNVLEAGRAGYSLIAATSGIIEVQRDWSNDGRASLAGPHNIRELGSYVDDLFAGNVIAVSDVRADSRVTAPERFEQFEARAFLNVPLMEGDRLVALMFADSQHPRHWSSEDIEFTRELGERTRTAIERRRAEHQLQELNARLEQLVAERTRELLRSEEQLRQSQKMEAVGQLTGGIAHDFNNLLTGISGSLELLQSRIQQGRIQDLDRYINAAQGASRRAAALTHRLLAFSRRQTLAPKPTHVNRLVKGMEELISRTMGPSVSIISDLSTDLWSVLIDPHQLENALLNLCINARDAMPDGGTLTISSRNRTIDALGAQTFDLTAGEYVALAVSDTGSGMAPEVAAKAFEPFFTTKPIGMGTGLGLSMIYGFIRQSGGQARIHSEPGRGCVVTLYLPRHLGEVREPSLVKPGAPPRAELGETVLIVDDEPTVRIMVTEVLEDLGYHAIEAADGRGGLQILNSGVKIDLLITDVGLPGGMNGRQMADAARVHRPDLKVLFITGYAESSVFENGDAQDGMHVLTKPFSVDSLARRVRGLIEQR
ncbi:ATP-binding protein [Pseudomonas japonica]|uniref:ATP-binding protein n=1 Tax=Pseudomonas japonica TaxID=256466 RepID=UPI0015E2F2ED|nr:ATP-binding protein [Pseudomonas japonica]MBA1242412.1 response regulator [Pseudomonas japonica]